MKSKYRLYGWFVMLIGGLIFSVAIDLIYFKSLFFNPFFHLITFIVGIILLRVVLIISRNTGRTLAKYGREGEISRFETNVLVDKGPYAYMRHPMHLGLLFFPLSIALIFGSPTFIFIIAPVEMLIMLLLIKWIEEPEARRKFGEKYEEFTQNRPWFCFKWKCLKSLFKKVEKIGNTNSPLKGC